jgi:hypothetical protein
MTRIYERLMARWHTSEAEALRYLETVLPSCFKGGAQERFLERLPLPLAQHARESIAKRAARDADRQRAKELAQAAADRAGLERARATLAAGLAQSRGGKRTGRDAERRRRH